MTENRRIVLNITATYARSLFAFACGVFGGRWALMSLGEVDYGLQGLVGGLTAFIGFLNGVLAAAVGRFYALSVGQSRKDPAAGLEEARRWFSIALLIHTAVPAVLLAIGWPIGEWAIRNFLTIPPDRVNACLWVFRFCCIGCFVGMVSVPFNAFYGAKQYIAELTIYGFITTALNISVLYYMVTHPRDWLVPYAAWLLVLGLVPSLIITGRAMKIFPECRFSFAYCRDWKRFRQLFTYAFWQFFGSLSVLMRGQGIAILVNKYFGPSFNASLAIARNVNGKANELGASLLGAFGPAITNAWGEGNFDRARKLALNVCKFSVLASFVFVLPLMIELPYAMRLWLKTPPDWVTPLCCAVMLQIMINRTTKGHLVLIQATGRIGLYESVAAGICLTMLPLAWLLIELGLGPWGLCISFVAVTAAYAWVRPFFASRLVGLSKRIWLRRVLFPLLVLAVATLGAGFLCRAVMPEGFIRLVVTTISCEIVLLPLAWAILFDAEDRIFISRKIFGERTARRVRGAYLSHAADPALRAEGETGGTVTALLLHLLKTGRIDGAVVSRYNSETRACEALYLESADEIASCAGSVYCQTPVVKVALEHADRRLAIVAVGCQSRLLSQLKMEKKIHEGTIVIGLICSGTYRPEYISAICAANGVDPSAVTGFRWKDKRFGKWPGNTMVRDASGWHDFPGDARKRLKDEYRLPACSSCADKMNENADFVVGDPWGMPELPYEEKQKGTNVLIVRSCVGTEILSASVKAGELTVTVIDPRRVFDGQKVPYNPGLLRRKFATRGGRMRKILVYGFPLAGNFGGPSVVHGLREAFRAISPEAEFVCWDRGGIDPVVYREMDFRVLCDPYFRHPVKLLRDYVATQWFGLRPRGEDKRAFWRDFRESDVVVNCYAISFHRKKGDSVHRHPFLAAIRRVLDFYGVSILARLTGRLSVKSASSYGPMATDYEKGVARLAAKVCFTRFIAREKESAEELRRVVGMADSVPVSPDVGNLMPLGGDAEVVQGRVGIAVSFRIVKEWEGKAEDYVACLAKLISHLRDMHGCSVLLIPNQLARAEGPNDAEIAERITETLSDRSCVETFDAAANGPLALKRAIASCEAMVSSRYHASVAGLSSGVPQLVIGWHRKYGELMDQYGQGKWMMATEGISARSLCERFDSLWRDRAAIRATILSNRDAVRETVLNTVRDVLEKGRENG